ncbi:MAG: DUF4301 family protein [Cytophagales bacterium]|nr:DUF4301 family protein [Cytophagales bacterium]
MSDSRDSRLDAQLRIFREGISPYILSSEAVIGSGLEFLSHKDLARFEKTYGLSKMTVQKFVPASGAATRMFKDLLSFKNESLSNESSKIFFENIGEIPFDIRESTEIKVLEELFEMMRIDRQPKGLLKFHAYDGFARSAAEEHLAEGLGYAKKQEKIKIHFTVSQEHLEDFKTHVKKARTQFSSNFEISFSTQNSRTDTVAVDLNNVPIKDPNGDMLFRPAGHGALLENLDALDADLIFIKNIDNVVPDRLKSETIKFKKILGGVLLDYQERVFNLLKRNDSGENILEEGKDLLERLGLKGTLSNAEVARKLNRPIRVCGMVKNQGEPGGGPFWVKSANGIESLQIVESAQVDHSDPEQEHIFKQSTHFNPVDLVCGVKDFKGKKFNLLEYRDPKTGFISKKSHNGQPIKALELPGLWNGSMADWNTIFVEVPLITFNPVKTVNDLLRPEHQS